LTSRSSSLWPPQLLWTTRYLLSRPGGICPVYAPPPPLGPVDAVSDECPASTPERTAAAAAAQGSCIGEAVGAEAVGGAPIVAGVGTAAEAERKCSVNGNSTIGALHATML
jgi:hypothetical protein